MPRKNKKIKWLKNHWGYIVIGAIALILGILGIYYGVK